MSELNSPEGYPNSPGSKPSSKATHLTARQLHIDAQITENAEDIVQIINDSETRNFQLGVILLVVAIGSWIVGLELVNSVLKGDEYRKPFMFAWYTGSCFSLNLTPDLYGFIKSKIVGTTSGSGSDVAQVSETDPLLSDAAAASPRSLTSSEKMSLDEGPTELSRQEVAVLAIEISIIYFAYNIFVMEALQYTSASNQTVLGSTTSIFTLFIGHYLKIDKFTAKKLICIFISLAGVIFINWSESGKESDGGSKFEPSNPILGNFLAILGALMYALYLIIMKIKCGTGKKTTNERKLFGWIGVCQFFLGIPVLIYVHYKGIEEFEFPPPSNAILFSVGVNGVLSFISDYATILAMLLTSPLVTSLSLTSAIPITIFIDFVVARFTGGKGNGGDTESNFIYFLGIISILVSVILINVNLTTENDLINEFIEEALEEAIREDEVLSPVLSPLLSPKSPYTANSPFLAAGISGSIEANQPVGVNFQTIMKSFSPKPKSAPVPQQPVSGFSLPQSQIEGFNSINAATDVAVPDGKLLVYGGENHHYHVKNLYPNQSSNRSDSTNDNTSY
ncbi:hypothetical protein CLIB1423_13S01420 [[Candida] railenensis]|uniref:EamA domain-containing protein n=1 Tax=[Candida] railenensis TaxID=45579 RepID=A0A9P0QQZ5_9ASCO|nr:hypothetical protein CLIB1423_13S01420 [[Candida] railenensis]